MVELAKKLIEESSTRPQNSNLDVSENEVTTENVCPYITSSEPIIDINDMIENVEYEIEIEQPVSNVQIFVDNEMGIETNVNEEIQHCDNIDNDNIVQTDIDSGNEFSNGRKRNAKLDSSNYAKNISKKNRMIGSEYQGYERSKTKEILYGKKRSKRMLGKMCFSKYCSNSKMRNCSLLTQAEREQLFTEFWKMTWDQKHIYVCNLIKQVTKKKLYTEGTSRRNRSLCYYLKSKNGELVQVCQKMFLNTLGVKEKMVRVWLNNSLPHGLQTNPAETSTKKKAKLSTTEKFVINEKRQSHLNLFFESYPKLESHYCRKDSKKIYLQTTSDSKTSLYTKEYKKQCIKDKIEPLSIFVFTNFLKEYNYAIFKPRKDQCDTCTEYKVGNLDLEKYNDHRTRVEKARKQMEVDQQLAQDGKIIMYCMDVQAVKLCPQLDASAQYYKMKLQIHNFTIYNVATHDSSNYMWDETQGQLLASCFTTIICNHIKRSTETNDAKVPIIIYSDGCGYQNRNEVLSNALFNLSANLQICIEQKYLEKGHTQNYCDSTHSLIERKIKGKTINLPSEFVSLAKEARKKPHPLDIQLLSFDYFLNYDDPDLKKYKSIRPGKLVGDPTVNQLRCLKYTPNGEISFKIHFDDQYKPIPQRCTSISTHHREPKRMYLERLTISQSKFNHLQDLKQLIPSDTHAFYNNIPFHPDKPKSKK